MKARARLLSFAVLFAAAAVCVAADNVNMGTWKLDEAKSKIAEGTPKNTTPPNVVVVPQRSLVWPRLHRRQRSICLPHFS